MKSFFDKIFFRSNNLDYVSKNIKNLTLKTPANKIFDAINTYNDSSEVRYVGGCIRKIINKEEINDIDFATTLEPKQVCDALSRKKIKYHQIGIQHGTITAVIDTFKFEITSLRKDVETDGRHAKIKFTQNWKDDASRRDFTINSIYSDREGNLFDPYNGKNDLEKGSVKFIGDADIRIKEDYLRILRYLRFFLDYSMEEHDPEIIKKLKINIGGVSQLSKERLIEELKKMLNLRLLEKISNDKLSLDLILVIFPELKNFKIFSKLSQHQKKLLNKNDFIFLFSLLVIDGTDNLDYFLYKYNFSKKDQKRMKIIDNFYKQKISKKNFSEENMNKFFYFNGRQSVIDVLLFRIINSNKIDQNLIDLCKSYEIKKEPILPIGANLLMKEYNVPEGKQLGLKLKLIEDEWVNNNFNISDQQIEKIIKN